MATHIAIEGEIPRLVNDIKVILPTVSFPYDDITSTSGLESIIALAGYEPCTVGSPPSVAWNQTAVLGVAARVGGVLTANYTATNLSENDAAVVLASYKQSAIAAVNAIDDTTFNTPMAYANNDNTKIVNLRPDVETLTNLTRLLLVAQTANAGVTVTDTNGNPVSMSLNDLTQIFSEATTHAQAITEYREKTKAAINVATSPAAINVAVAAHAENYGPPA
jgi:hypothetical protein